MAAEQGEGVYEDEDEDEDEDPPAPAYSRPSEWLDQLLINEYLSGYPSKAHVGEEGQIAADCNKELLDQDSLLDKPEIDATPQNGSGSSTQGMLSAEEASWMAQYGQVHRSESDAADLADIIKAVDLWDWELLLDERGTKGHSRTRARLTGRLLGHSSSSSLHPSLPSSGGTLKTTAIRQVHLDHVLVASGKVYRLRTPSKRYLATLSEYDSSNPTKDWGFPLLSPNPLSRLSPPPPPPSTCDLRNVDLYLSSQNKEEKGEYRNRYRDRAAERRRLHGANGIAPCQKGHDSDTRSASDDDPTIAQEEARLLSFGTQSYGGKIMQSMGWKQGEALGGSRKGILEPLQAIGNIGTAGLGWKHN